MHRRRHAHSLSLAPIGEQGGRSSLLTPSNAATTPDTDKENVQRQDKRRRSNSGTGSQMTSLQRMQMLLRQNMTLEERLHRAQSK